MLQKLHLPIAVLLVVLVIQQCSLQATSLRHVWRRLASVNQTQHPIGDSAYTSLCTVMRDDPPHYVQEFIRYYRWLGFGRIYLFDHYSKPHLLDSIQEFLDTGFVEYHYFAGHLAHVDPVTRQKPTVHHSAQISAYKTCLKMARGMHVWMAFFDSDEFLIPRDPAFTDINTFLRNYTQHPALAINWRMFGTSGHNTMQPSALKAFTKCSARSEAQNKHVKTIAQVSKVAATSWSPHAFRYHNGEVAVTPDKQPLAPESPFHSPPSYSKVVLHHYMTRSVQDFRAKQRRGSAMARGGKPDTFLHMMDALSTQTCTDAVELYDKCCKPPQT